MSEWLDKAAVGIALIASAGYAAIALGPKGLRRQVALALLGAVPRTPRVLGLRRLVARAGEAVAAKVPGGCGGCGGCEPTDASGHVNRGASGEVHVPIGKIGRRGP